MKSGDKKKATASVIQPFKRKAIPYHSSYPIQKTITDIWQVLNQLKLVPQTSPEYFIEQTKGYKHRYYSICFTDKKEKVFFYYLMRNNASRINNFKKEITLAKQITNNPQLKNNYIFPNYLSWSEKPYWMLVKYEPGKALEQKGFPGKLAITLSDKQITKLAQTMHFIQFELSKKLNNIKSFDSTDVEQTLMSLLNITLPELVSKKIINQKLSNHVSSFLHTVPLNILKQSLCLCHSDFHPSNILLKNKHTFKIIDWENYKFDLFTADLAHIYCRMTYARTFVKELIKNYYHLLDKKYQVNFNLIFRTTILIFALTKSVQERFYEMSQNERNKYQQWIKKVIENATISYSKLIRI